MASEDNEISQEGLKQSSSFTKQSYQTHMERQNSRSKEHDDWPYLSSLLEDDYKESNSHTSASKRSNAYAERSDSRTSASARRLSDRSSGSDRATGDGTGTNAIHGYDTFPRSASRNSNAGQSNRPVDLFRDDFDARMEEMVREFDRRCARSLWDDEEWMRGSLFNRNRGGESSFMTRSRAISDKFFGRSGIFDDGEGDFGFGRRRMLRGFDDADSGIFSDGTMTSRGRHHSDDSFAIDKALRQERRCTPEKFEVDIDVKGFKANELLVKTEGNKVIVCAKAKDEADHDLVSRELKREFDLPEGVDPYDVTSSLMPDGFLHVEAPVRMVQLKRQASKSSNASMSLFESSSSERSTSTVKSPGI